MRVAVVGFPALGCASIATGIRIVAASKTVSAVFLIRFLVKMLHRDPARAEIIASPPSDPVDVFVHIDRSCRRGDPRAAVDYERSPPDESHRLPDLRLAQRPAPRGNPHADAHR